MTRQADTAAIKDIVSKIIKDIGKTGHKHERISEERIKGIWKKAAGKLAGKRSLPTSLRKGRLVVVVKDSSLLCDLTLRKRDVLGVLKTGLPGRIKDVQFRIGEVSEEKKKRKGPKTKG